MNKRDLLIFNSIKEELEKDKEHWEKFQNDNTALLTPEMSKFEDSILTREFLVYYAKKYLELNNLVEKLNKVTD